MFDMTLHILLPVGKYLYKVNNKDTRKIWVEAVLVSLLSIFEHVYFQYIYYD